MSTSSAMLTASFPSVIGKSSTGAIGFVSVTGSLTSCASRSCTKESKSALVLRS